MRHGDTGGKFTAGPWRQGSWLRFGDGAMMGSFRADEGFGWRRNPGQRAHPEADFISLTGMAGFLAGAALAGVALVIGLVQIASAWMQAAHRRMLPAALSATATGFVAGAWLCLAAEFRWVSGDAADTLAIPIGIVALWWIYRNRLGADHPAERPSDDAPR